jgi:peptidoglycan/LPS O-acetylase OafA/YrhL
MGTAPIQTRKTGLDLLRATAILAILMLHANLCVSGLPTFIGRIFSVGWAGVDLFFVLSGFLIGSQTFAENLTGPLATALKSFWIRRWLRTLPLYFTVLAFYALVKPGLGAPFSGWNWSFLFFGQNYLPLYDFIQSWSLCIEEQFYLLFPIVVFVLLRGRKAPPWLWLIPVFLGIALRLGSGSTLSIARAPMLSPQLMDFAVRFPAYTHLDGIAMGILLAATATTWKNWRPWLCSCLGALGLLIVAGVLYWDPYPSYAGTQWTFTYTLLALGFSGILIGALELHLHPALAKPIEKLAIWSYGAYLWNNVLIRTFSRLQPHWHWTIGVLVFACGSFAMAWLTFVIIETPALKWRSLLLRRMSPANSLGLSAGRSFIP